MSSPAEKGRRGPFLPRRRGVSAGQEAKWAAGAFFLATLAGLMVCALASPAGVQTVWELTPYKVRVILALGHAPELTPGFRSELTRELHGRVDALVGAFWDVRVTEPGAALRYAMLRDVETVTVELVEAEWSNKEATASAGGVSSSESPSPAEATSPAGAAVHLDDLDKVILLVVLPGPAGYRVVARELDVRTRQWNTPASVPVWHDGKLRDAAFAAMRRAFAPLAQVVAVEQSDVTLRLRAAGFPLRDKTIVMVRPGDLFRPVIRHNDRYGKVKGVLAIEWTFLTVEEVAPAGLACKLYTGLRSPLSGRRRGRYEQLALAVAPPGKPTRLTLQSRTKPHDPLIGYDVYSHPPGSKKTDLVGRTDRLGSVVVPPTDDPLRVLVVKNGSEFLARLPMIPGMEDEVVADIRNDDQRLEAEGFIRGLQEELIDLVIRREVLLAQYEARFGEKKYDEAEKLIRQLRALETRDDFALHLAQEQKKVFSADKLSQAKIDQMFSKTRKLVITYLDPAIIDQLDRQLREARGGRL